jgi:hypothetical protein
MSCSHAAATSSDRSSSDVTDASCSACLATPPTCENRRGNSTASSCSARFRASSTLTIDAPYPVTPATSSALHCWIRLYKDQGSRAPASRRPACGRAPKAPVLVRHHSCPTGPNEFGAKDLDCHPRTDVDQGTKASLPTVARASSCASAFGPSASRYAVGWLGPSTPAARSPSISPTTSPKICGAA